MEVETKKAGKGFSVHVEENQLYQVGSIEWEQLGEGTGNPLQYSCLETPMDGGAW